MDSSFTRTKNCLDLTGILPFILAAATIPIPVTIAWAQSEPAALPAPKDDVFHQDVAWSPDGRMIAFSEYTGGKDYKPDRWRIAVISADGAERRVLVENAFYVTWSPDGKQLAFGSERDGNPEIYRIGSDGAGLLRLTHHDARDRLPAWAPKGNKIAFCSDRDGNEDIYVMSPDGSDVKRLTDDPGRDFNPAWSADGKQITFFREKGDRKDQVYVMAADGSAQRRITNGEGHHTFPSFLPDGRIAFASMDSDSGTKLVRVDSSGENETQVGSVPAFFARWSPDGTRIAFIAGNWPKSAIYVMNADQSSIRKLVN